MSTRQSISRYLLSPCFLSAWDDPKDMLWGLPSNLPGKTPKQVWQICGIYTTLGYVCPWGRFLKSIMMHILIELGCCMRNPSHPSSPRSPYQSFSIDPRKENWFLFLPWTNMTRTATYSELFCDKWYSIMRNLEDTEILQGHRTWMSWPTKWNLSSMLEERCDWNWHKRRRVSPWQTHGWRHWSDREDPTSTKDREQLRTSLLMYNYLTKD